MIQLLFLHRLMKALFQHGTPEYGHAHKKDRSKRSSLCMLPILQLKQEVKRHEQ